MHTAVKIAHVYDGPVIHVLDASRAVTVCSSLLDATLKQELLEDIHETYAELREEHYAGLEDRKFFSLAETRAKKPVINWSSVRPTVPNVLGNKVLHDCDLASLIPYIDWTPFFDTWQLKGKYPNKKYPKIFQDETVGAEAKRLYDEASLMLQDIIRDKSIQARGVFGIYPANSDGDDILVFTDESRSTVKHRFHSLRQQEEVPGQNTYLAMADFIAPVSSGVKDYIGAFAVSAGFGADALCAKYEAENDDYRKIMTQALADRLAEAFAEKLHRDVRVEHWGYSKGEDVDAAGLLQVKCVHTNHAVLRVPYSILQIHWDPSCSGLSGPARPHREDHHVVAAGCAVILWHRAHRVAGHVSAVAFCPQLPSLCLTRNFQASCCICVGTLPCQRVRSLLFTG
jgi:5-methyltetrahydrofolate--homocysteine methyltransferase